MLSSVLSSVLMVYLLNVSGLNTLRPRRNGRHFADDIFELNFIE